MEVVNERGERVEASTLDSASYKQLRGTLRCATEGCAARAVFVDGDTPHFRTWRGDEHDPSCPHVAEPTRTPRPNNRRPRRPITERQAEQSLDSFYDELVMPKRTVRRAARTTPRAPRPRIAAPKEQLSLFDVEGGWEDGDVMKRGRLLKRAVSQLTPSDVGKLRTVAGLIDAFDVYSYPAQLVLKDGKNRVAITCSETFYADPFSVLYEKMFPQAVVRLERERRAGQLTICFAVVELVSEQNGHHEALLHHGDHLRMNRETILEWTADERQGVHHSFK